MITSWHILLFLKNLIKSELLKNSKNYTHCAHTSYLIKQIPSWYSDISYRHSYHSILLLLEISWKQTLCIFSPIWVSFKYLLLHIQRRKKAEVKRDIHEQDGPEHVTQLEYRPVIGTSMGVTHLLECEYNNPVPSWKQLGEGCFISLSETIVMNVLYEVTVFRRPCATYQYTTVTWARLQVLLLEAGTHTKQVSEKNMRQLHCSCSCTVVCVTSVR